MGRGVKKRREREYPGATRYQDRHGKWRWRYRAGALTIQLGADYGSAEFEARYAAAVRGEKRAGAGADRTRAGSLDALCVSYYRSPQFLNLAATTKATYRGVIEALRRDHGPKLVAQLERRHVLALMSEKHETPGAANSRLKRLRQMLDHAVEIGMRNDNPAAGVKLYRLEGGGFHPWSELEIARFLAFHPSDTLPHLAMTLMLYTGAAKVDAVRMGWANVRAGRVSYRRQKTRRAGAVLIDIRVQPPLAEALAAARDRLPETAITFLHTAQGRSRTAAGLGNAMREWCDAAGLPECSSHGLRKACARRLAEAGATPHMIQAVTGHKTLAEVERYTAAANRADLSDDAWERYWGRAEGNVAALHPGKSGPGDG
jgi:integrase